MVLVKWLIVLGKVVKPSKNVRRQCQASSIFPLSPVKNSIQQAVSKINSSSITTNIKTYLQINFLISRKSTKLFC